VGTWYYFNKNMNVYAAYKFNQLDDNDYTKAAGVTTTTRLPWVSFTSSNQYTLRDMP
jgi:predicted porin